LDDLAVKMQGGVQSAHAMLECVCV
jgi:hypothetical protein